MTTGFQGLPAEAFAAAPNRSMFPARRARLIGRDREISHVRDQMLHGDRRLLTLDRGQILADARERAARVFARL